MMMRQFHTCSVFRGGKQHRVAVWNGVRDFQSRPPNNLIKQLQGETAVARINKPMSGERSAIDVVDFYAAVNFDGIVLWARNRKVYQSIVNELKQETTTH